MCPPADHRGCEPISSSLQSSFSCAAGSWTAIGSRAPSHPGLHPIPGSIPSRAATAEMLPAPVPTLQPRCPCPCLLVQPVDIIPPLLLSPSAVLQPVCSLGAEPHRLVPAPGEAASRRVLQLGQALDGE